MTNRRDFLKGSTLAAAGGMYLTQSSCQPQKEPVDQWTATRRSLIAKANFGKKEPVSGQNGLAISSHPLVTNEAVRVLREGGNAADAILAASITQSVVEPHMTTLTGVFSILYHEAATGKNTFVNGSCNAPLGFDRKGFDMTKFRDYLKTAKGVIVPGFWGGFEKAHELLCTKPMKDLMSSAIRYAREGFEVHPFLFGEMFVTTNNIGVTEEGREIFMPNGRLVNPGEMIYQKKAADLLERLAEEGSGYFYRGGFAKKFCDVMRGQGGIVTEEDFEKYEAMVQSPTEGSYREFQVIGSPPPDYGGTSMVEILQMAEHIDFQQLGSPKENPEVAMKMMQVLGEVLTAGTIERLEDRLTPIEKALSKEYAAERFAKLDGVPKNMSDYYKRLLGDSAVVTPPPGSNHLTVVDKDGNVATVLHSVMSWPWSNGLFVDGISIAAVMAHYASGLPQPGGRINARICPTIIFKDGKPVLASGSPSISLMQSIFQLTVQILDFEKTPEEAANMSRWGGDSLDSPGATLIEVDYSDQVIAALEKKGVKLQKVSPWNWSMGSFEAIFIDPDSRIAYACGDPRRNAMAMAV